MYCGGGPCSSSICLSNSSGSVGSIGGVLCPWAFKALAPFSRRNFSSSTAFLVLARNRASAMSPKNGTRPTAKSRTILNIIFDLTLAGRPPSTCWHVRRTIMAIKASITSPTLQRQFISYGSRILGNDAYAGMIPITLLQPNLIPQQLKRLISRRYARLLTFVRTFASCSEIPGGRALRLFLPFLLEGRPSSLVAGTVSKYGS